MAKLYVMSWHIYTLKSILANHYSLLKENSSLNLHNNLTLQISQRKRKRRKKGWRVNRWWANRPEDERHETWRLTKQRGQTDNNRWRRRDIIIPFASEVWRGTKHMGHDGCQIDEKRRRMDEWRKKNSNFATIVGEVIERIYILFPAVKTGRYYFHPCQGEQS